jgi:hypothetical protein
MTCLPRRLSIGSEHAGDGVGLGDAQLLYWSPLGAAVGQRSGDVKVRVWHALMRWDPVVLPDRHTFGAECFGDEEGCLLEAVISACASCGRTSRIVSRCSVGITRR